MHAAVRRYLPGFWLALLFTGAVLFIGCAPANAGLLDAGVVAAGVADVVTTERALRHPGLREGNPLMQSPEVRIGAKTLVMAGVLAGTHVLEKRGKKGTARAVKIVVIALWGGAAVNNVLRERQAR